MSKTAAPSTAADDAVRRRPRGGVVADALDAAVRQGLKRPLPSPSRIARSLAGRDRLRDAVGGEVVVVTGASSGIGEAAARRFAAAGASVVLVARRGEELERVAAEIVGAGGTAEARVCDLSDKEAAAELGAALVADHGRVDVLINNAGRSIRRPVAESYDRFHDFERTMALNYFGPVALTLAVLPTMLDGDRGQVINISSWATQLPSPNYVAYTASKAALDAFTRGTAAELLGTGVILTSVHLPLVRTPMITPAIDAYKGMPSISADEAAGLIAEAAVGRTSRVEPAIVSLAHIGDAISARATDAVFSGMQRLKVGPIGRGRSSAAR